MNPKKRNRSIISNINISSHNMNSHSHMNSCSSPPLSCDHHYQNGNGNGDLDGDRRKRNREHAKRSRQRKKSLTSGLEQSLADLKEENAKLRDQVYAKLGPKKADALVQERMAKSTGAFVTSLQKRESAVRVLDSDTLKFLQGLRKEMPVAPSPVRVSTGAAAAVNIQLVA
jgi:hypothetical protein